MQRARDPRGLVGQLRLPGDNPIYELDIDGRFGKHDVEGGGAGARHCQLEAPAEPIGGLPLQDPHTQPVPARLLDHHLRGSPLGSPKEHCTVVEPRPGQGGPNRSDGQSGAGAQGHHRGLDLALEAASIEPADESTVHDQRLVRNLDGPRRGLQRLPLRERQGDLPRGPHRREREPCPHSSSASIRLDRCGVTGSRPSRAVFVQNSCRAVIVSDRRPSDSLSRSPMCWGSVCCPGTPEGCRTL